MRVVESCPSCRALRGFTLIEVLAALLIVGFGMLAVIEAVSQTARNSGYLREKTLAHWIAMNRLTEARLESQPPKIDKSSDEVEMANRRWRWTMVVTQSPLESVRRIDVSVRSADAPENSSLASITGFYGKAIGAPGTVLVPSWRGDASSGPGGDNGDGTGDDNNDNQQQPPKNPPPPDNDNPEPPPEEPPPEPPQE